MFVPHTRFAANKSWSTQLWEKQTIQDSHHTFQ